MSPPAAQTRVREFLRATLELVADELRPIDEGWVLRTPSLPLVWSANQVRIGRPIELEAALALCERHLGDLPYRHLVIEDDAAGAALEAGFRSLGWGVDREVVMELVRSPDREVDASAVTEASEEDALGLMVRWMDEDPGLNETAESLEQLREFNRRGWRARDARRLGVIGPDGSLAAITMLFSDGAAAQVEDVYTVPEARGRGFARALVTHATELARGAGHELVFIVADDNDSPKRLYARIGFEPVGKSWIFHRRRAHA